MSDAETTIILTDAADAEIYSCQPRFNARMAKLGITPTRTSGDACWYAIPKRWVKIKKPRVYTEAQRAVMAERARRVFHKEKGE